MPTVAELTEPYTNILRNPLPHDAAGVCSACTTFAPGGFDTCYQCGHSPRFAAAVLPITYSVDGGQVHHTLAGYKPRGEIQPHTRFQRDLIAILWRFVGLHGHEDCLAAAAGVERFDLVTTVPSSNPARDQRHPLPRIVGEGVEPLKARYRPLLRRSSLDLERFERTADRYELLDSLAAETVLLVDDTWTSGTSAESAAAALLGAGASTVGVLVIGRHITPSPKNDHTERMKNLPRSFNWKRCAYCPRT